MNLWTSSSLTSARGIEAPSTKAILCSSLCNCQTDLCKEWTPWLKANRECNNKWYQESSTWALILQIWQTLRATCAWLRQPTGDIKPPQNFKSTTRSEIASSRKAVERLHKLTNWFHLVHRKPKAWEMLQMHQLKKKRWCDVSTVMQTS